MAKRPQQPDHKNEAAAADADTRRSAVDRLLASGKVKEAFKEAKLYFHRDPSAENRQLVERTYIHRIQSLSRDGMTAAGHEVALSALEFGVQDPSLLRELILLLPRVGLADRAWALQGQLGSPEVRTQLFLRMADRAVLHPENGGESLPELLAAAGPVRLAFAALDAGDDARALELLQPVPRSSPMADWRYFVRGLVAFRQDDREQTKANWERLDPQRAARKIARTLLPEAGPESGGSPRDYLKALEARAFGEPVLERLADLRAALAADDWKRVLRVVGPLRQTLARIDRRCAQRLTEILLLPLSAELERQPLRGAQRLLAEFKAALEPLPWDPNWHRFEALVWEGPQGDPDEAVRLWRKYLQDLERGAPGLPGEGHQVQALVWRRIGEILSGEADPDRPDGFPFGPRRPEARSKGLRVQAAEALQQSLRLDPTQRQTHQLLIDNFTAWDDPARAVAALEGLLRAFPDDVDALRQLIRERRLRDEPEPVLSCVERLRKLKPLDTELDRDETWGRLARARHLALKGRWDDARAEFGRVEAALKEHVDPYRLLARQAALEFKAGDAARAEELVERARLLLKEPTPLWLVMVIELTRYELPAALADRFQRSFEAALAKKVTGETAGELAELTGANISYRVVYPRRAGHTEDVLRYLRRSTRTKYREPDLRRVCEMLMLVGTDDKLLTALSNRGRKLFPRSPFFLRLDATQDVMRGPMSFNPQQTRAKLEQALALAQASQDPDDAALIPGIQELLGRVRSVTEMMSSLPPPFLPPGGPGAPGAFRDVVEMLMNQFGPDLDPDGGEEPAGGPGNPPKRKRK